MYYDLAVIGGGASGIAAALCACERGKSVVILERANRMGKKLLQTGNGKCNLGSVPFSAEKYNRPAFAERLFQEISPATVYRWLEEEGVYLRTTEGRIYPYSEQAATLLNAFRTGVERGKIPVLTEFSARKIEGKQPFEIFAEDGRTVSAKTVLLATGSPAGGGTDSIFLYFPYGHTAKKFHAALCPLLTEVEPIRGWRGIRFHAKATLAADGEPIAETTDEILVKDNGLSGSAIFYLSSFLARRKFSSFSVVLDFLPELNGTEAVLKTLPLTAFFHKEIAEKLNKFPHPFEAAKRYEIKGKSLGNFELAQVASGGLFLEEFDENFQSVRQKGLYAAGEALDMDGECGGYNLTWAFASGMKVGGAV